MNIVFRCDAGSEYGLGHLSRCMVLANELLKTGIKSRFAINSPESICKKISKEGHQIQILANSMNFFEDPTEWVGDARFVLLDSPKITEQFARKVKNIANVGFFDDDIARDYEVDLIINNHLWANISDYSKIDIKRSLLLGPKYNTVNPNYFHQYENRYGLLVTMGGEDPENTTSWIIRELARLKVRMPITIVVGPAHPNPPAVSNDVKKYLPFSEIYFSPDTLVPFMKKCHVAITAGGTTCYELAASKIPFAVFALEEGQIRLSQAVVDFGFGVSIGSYNKNSHKTFENAINCLIMKETSESMIRKAAVIYSKSGVDFIVQKITSLQK